jgi:hypothetical protein
MKRPAVLSLVAVALLSLTGCPEKKPDGAPEPSKPQVSSAPANAPAAPANAPKQGGGW